MSNNTEQLLNYFQQSEKENEKLHSLWEEFSGLSNTEKLVFCLNLPTGAHRDNNRDVQTKVKSEVTQATAWIKTHLQVDKEQCLAKQEVYDDYLHFCKKQNVQHVGKEDFGKLMKTVYPSVTTRRLGMRGQTKHCYGGLAKKTEVDAPVLPEIMDLKQQETGHEVKGDRKSIDSPIDRKDVVKSCCAVIVEWAQKLLNEKFSTINDIAEYLVLKSYVNVSSEAAYTILSQVPKYREENSSTEQPVPRTTPQPYQQVSSSGSRSARLQLQMKLQEKEKLKEQKRKLEQQRCAITGETPPCEECNDSADTATVSYDASVSSETTTSNQDHVARSVTVPKPILPKPVPLIMPSTAYVAQSSSSIGSINSSFTSIAPGGQNPLPTTSTPQRPPSAPLFIVSPTPNSPSVNQMVLVSPLNVSAANTTQPLLTVQQQQQFGSVPTSVVSSPGSISVEWDQGSSGASQTLVHMEKPKELLLDSGAVSGGQTSVSNNTDIGARTQVFSQLDAASPEENLCEERQNVDALQKGKKSKGSRKSEKKVHEVIQRSQSMPESIEHVSAKSVIEHSDSSKVQMSQSGELAETIDAQNIKQEADNVASQNIPHGVYINFKLSDADSGSAGTNVTVPIGTLDTSAISPTGIPEHDTSSDTSTHLTNNIASALNAQLIAMLQSSGVGGRNIAPQKKAVSKTVSSLLKEQRVRVRSPECTGKNRYVNDNRPVAQILKELREKKKYQTLSPGGATQNLSFSDEITPEEATEQLASQKVLRERIAREALLMRKAQVPSSSLSRPRRKSRHDAIKKSYISPARSPARSPVNTAPPKRKEPGKHGKLEELLAASKTSQFQDDILSPQNMSDNITTDHFPSTGASRVVQETVTSQDTSGDADMTAKIGRKESVVLKLLLEEALGKEAFNKVLTGRTVTASTNPKLVSLLSSNNEKKAVNVEKQQAVDTQKKLIAELLQKLSESANRSSQLESTSTVQPSVSKMMGSNTPWNLNTNLNYTYPTLDNHSSSAEFENHPSTTDEILDLVTPRNMGSEPVGSRSASCIEMNSAFMPIQSVTEVNNVSLVKPQVKTVGSHLELNSRGTQMNATLKALLSQENSRQNSPIEHVDEMYNTSEWVARQSSNFVPYSQNCSNVPEEDIPLNMNMSNPELQPMHPSMESNAFSQSNNNNEYILNNATLGSASSNNNSGFASMVGVKPPMKRSIDSDGGFASKRSRHLSDQSHIRPKRSEFGPPPLQSLLPQEQTMSQESLAMVSPSSHGYGQCPPESPFSPEVHDIMSNPSDVFTGDFSNAMSNNNLRSVSVPAHNFMQGNLELGAASGTYLAQEGGMMSGMQCVPQNYSEPSQQVHAQQSNYSYQQQQPQQQPMENTISSAYRSDNNNSATYNSVKKNLLQILESRLAFRNAANQNLRGDHMISGASVKLPQNMRHKIGETLSSVMMQNMNQNIQYPGNSILHGQIHPLQVPNPTPPESHPPTPVEFCSDVNDKFDGGNHGYQMTQPVVMGCNMIPTTVDGTPTSLENVSSQSSRESLADPLFNMCEENSGGVEMQGNNQFDFLRIL